MSLLLAQTQGTNDFRFATAQAHIISIARMDTGVGFSSATTTLQGVVCSTVTYSRTLNGPTSVRLDALVHDTGFTTPRQIVVMAVPDGTTFNGTLVSVVGGIALNVGEAGNPFTSAIAAIYDADDCHGTGRWVDKEGGGTTSFPPDVVLYHELAHCFHDATGVTTTEPLAEVDENVMRDARGLSHRDTASHNGGCGGGSTSCCIVASLATGSSQSAEVQRLRRFREHVLRRSIVGDEFFKLFHERYYQFSPEVTRLMGRRPSLAALIKERFVLPLIAVSELFIEYVENRGVSLSAFMRLQSEHPDFARIYDESHLRELQRALDWIRTGSTHLPASAIPRRRKYRGLRELLRHVNEQTVRDEYIAWSLVDTVELWARCALALHSGRAESEIDRDICEALATWVAQLPVAGIWGELSRLEAEIELEHLGTFMLDRRSREVFGGRLVASQPRLRATVEAWVTGKRGTDARA